MKVFLYLVATVAAAILQAYAVQAQDKACVAENGVRYNPQKLFDDLHDCYPQRPEQCPKRQSVCANHALIKLANYEGHGKSSNDYQDLIYSPHRGLWGQTYGTADPSVSAAPAQNTNDAFGLVNSFVTKYPRNRGNVDYGAFLRGRIVELDMTVSGGDVMGGAPQVLVDHYITTANTVEGDINTYLSSMSSDAIAAADFRLERRDFSPSGMMLFETPVAQVTRKSIIDPEDPDLGLIAYHDIKARRGMIQCQTSALQKGAPAYERYRCRYNEPEVAEIQQLDAEIGSAAEMYKVGGGKNVVIKTTATFPKMLEHFGKYYGKPEAEALNIMKRYMWQPHPKGAGKTDFERIGYNVQYIHDWLVSVPRSVQAWEMNIYYTADATNLPFCVTRYTGPTSAYPRGHVEVRLVASINDKNDCTHGPYYNMLDYLRQNTGNPKYFGFTSQLLVEGPISGNRANLWLLDTASAAGTSDREYRWMMLGSDKTYNMSDAVRYLSYPYVAYQILNADRMDVVKQVIDKRMYQEWGGFGPTSEKTFVAAAPVGQQTVDRAVLEARLEQER